MTITRSAVAAVAALAAFISLGAHGATRDDAIAALKSAKAGDGARLGASLSILERASERRVPQSDVTYRVTRKLPALRASDGYVSVSAYGDDLAALRTQLTAKGLKGAVVHSTAVSGRAPVAALRDMSATSGLKFLRPTLAMARGQWSAAVEHVELALAAIDAQRMDDYPTSVLAFAGAARLALHRGARRA